MFATHALFAMRTTLALVLAALLTGCASYQVQPKETSLREVLVRWADKHDKTVKWDIDDLVILEPTAMNEQLRKAGSLPEAVSIFLNMAEKGRIRLAAKAGEARPDPVMACIYDNAILVTYHRSAAIACSKTVLPSFR